MKTDTLALELHDVSRRYGAHFVLRDLNLRVSAGKTVVLAGENGAGKTTLLKLLATRLRPSLGRGRVFGYDLVKEGAKVRQRIAYLTVLGGLYGTLTALENLRLAGRLYGQDQTGERLEPLLERVGLLSASDKPVHSFSSGMKKRLGVARLLLADAPLWLLDEPYAALDEAGKTLIDDLLLDARAQGKTVVMASHELERSALFADKVLRLEGGGLVVVEGSPQPPFIRGAAEQSASRGDHAEQSQATQSLNPASRLLNPGTFSALRPD